MYIQIFIVFSHENEDKSSLNLVCKCCGRNWNWYFCNKVILCSSEERNRNMSSVNSFQLSFIVEVRHIMQQNPICSFSMSSCLLSYAINIFVKPVFCHSHEKCFAHRPVHE